MKARSKYLGVARQMREYEEKKYEQWREYVEGILLGLLKRNLLTKPTATMAIIPVSHSEGDGTEGSSASNHAMQGKGFK